MLLLLRNLRALRRIGDFACLLACLLACLPACLLMNSHTNSGLVCHTRAKVLQDLLGHGCH